MIRIHGTAQAHGLLPHLTIYEFTYRPTLTHFYRQIYLPFFESLRAQNRIQPLCRV